MNGTVSVVQWFEVLLEFESDRDPVLRRLGRVVHAIEITGELDADPPAAGLLAVTAGALAVTGDDQRIAGPGGFVYDAVHTWCHPDLAVPAGGSR